MATEALWICGGDSGCGWSGRASELQPNPSEINVCPACGTSGGLGLALLTKKGKEYVTKWKSG